MKKKSTSQSGFFNLRVLIGLFVFLAGVFVALLGFGAFSNVFAQTKGTRTAPQTNPSNGTQTPSGSSDIVQMVGPVAQNQDLRNLPYIPPKEEFDEKPLTRYPHPGTGLPPQTESSSFQWLQSLIKGRDKRSTERLRLYSARHKWRRGAESLRSIGQHVIQGF